MESTPITATRFFRQDSKPTSPPDGATWLTNSDGAGDDTTSRYVFDAASGTWDLESAVGPSEPTAGNPVPGSTWRDTSESAAKQYNGTGFVKLGGFGYTAESFEVSGGISYSSWDEIHRFTGGFIAATGSYSTGVNNTKVRIRGEIDGLSEVLSQDSNGGTVRFAGSTFDEIILEGNSNLGGGENMAVSGTIYRL